MEPWRTESHHSIHPSVKRNIQEKGTLHDANWFLIVHTVSVGNVFCLHLFMKLSREAGVLWMEWMFLFTRSSTEEVAALSSFMLLQ